MENRLSSELKPNSDNPIFLDEQINEAIKKKNFRVGFYTETENFLNNYIAHSGLNSGIAIGGLPNDYFDKMVDAVFAFDSILARNDREQIKLSLAGYWVKYAVTHRF
jgi:hypothetical protein